MNTNDTECLRNRLVVREKTQFLPPGNAFSEGTVISIVIIRNK